MMKSSTCSCKTREHIKSEVQRKLLQYSNFSCSICGEIPVVFHHIEEWSNSFSNDEDILIPICDKCHRGIHGEGGTMYSKDELYKYKAEPIRPSLLLDKHDYRMKEGFSFFIGSNFVAQGTEASLFKFSGRYGLLSIDTSAKVLKLSILAKTHEGEGVYLIKDNLLMINTEDIWNMRYSRSSLKIWRMIGNKKTVFIDLNIKPDIIIIREMNTIFDGKPFRIYKLRKPHQRQVKKIESKVRQYEKLYYGLAVEIDNRPQISGEFDGLDIDACIKQTQKDILRINMESELKYAFCENFNWDWSYCQWVLSQVLSESDIFGKNTGVPSNVPEKFMRKVEKIKIKYKKEFDESENIVVDYNGIILLGNFLM